VPVCQRQTAKGGSEADGVVRAPPKEACLSPQETWHRKSVGEVTTLRGRKNSNSLPANSELRQRAKELRKAGILSEVLMWQQLHKKKFKGYDFDRQKIIGSYIVDFYCTNCHVVIEIDGKSHDSKAEYDNERDAFLQGLGLTVIRILAHDVLYRMDDVMRMLNEHPALQKDILAASRHVTTPSRLACHPSKEGN